MPYFKEVVSDKIEQPVRLDVYIGSMAGMNRSKLKSGVQDIFLNNKKAKLSTKVKSGDVIEFFWEDNVPDDILPENIPLKIIYEDENVTVINKDQGMVTHPAAGNWEGTLVNALLYHWQLPPIHQIDGEGEIKNNFRRPGIVHRLDKDTSGVIITARNRDTEEFLARQFKDHNGISKIYICICKGHPPLKEGVIRTNLTRDSNDRKKIKVVPEGEDGKLAVTKFKCIGCWGPYSLIKVRIFTGRTHQIRVHLKFIGCPVLGDPIYSKVTKGSLFEKATLMLHAYRLKINIPGKQETSVFTAPVPVRFKKAIKLLHEKYKKSFPPESPSKKIFVFSAKKGYGQWQK